MAPCLPSPVGPRTSSHLRFLIFSTQFITIWLLHCCKILLDMPRVVCIHVFAHLNGHNRSHLGISLPFLQPTTILFFLLFIQQFGSVNFQISMYYFKKTKPKPVAKLNVFSFVVLNIQRDGQKKNVSIFFRMQTSICLHSLLGLGSLPWVSLMTALTLEQGWEQRITGMLKTGGTEKTHHGSDNREVTMVRDDKQGGMREFPL